MTHDEVVAMQARLCQSQRSRHLLRRVTMASATVAAVLMALSVTVLLSLLLGWM